MLVLLEVDDDKNNGYCQAEFVRRKYYYDENEEVVMMLLFPFTSSSYFFNCDCIYDKPHWSL